MRFFLPQIAALGIFASILVATLKQPFSISIRLSPYDLISLWNHRRGLYVQENRRPQDLVSSWNHLRGLHVREGRVLQVQALKNKTRSFGDVTVDFYRTYKEKQFLGIKWKDYSIPKWRLSGQIEFLNSWYEGRVNFFMGDVYTFEDPDFSGDVDCFRQVFNFSESPEIRNSSRLSALYVKKLRETTNGCAIYNIPLGGFRRLAPVVLVGMSSDFLLASSSTLGIQNVAAATLSHELGHVIGFNHTTEPEETVASYSLCGDLIRYPQFSSDCLGDLLTNVVFRNDIIWDDVTGERYEYNDWQGRTNVMSPFSVYHVLSPFEIGIFRNGYERVFEQILECWFSRSRINLRNRANGTSRSQLEEALEIDY